jgi:hypothetical protein
MKTIMTILIGTFILFFSCNSVSEHESINHEEPKALEEKSSYEEISKVRNDNLVESLYNELVEKTPELKQLESKIEVLEKSKNDSIILFTKYNQNNQSYYHSVNSNLVQIKDSLLRNKIKLLITNSLKKYNSQILKQEELLKLMDLKSVTLNDLHTILKITKSLSVIEKYQTENMPSAKSLERYLKELDGTIQTTDSLANQ